MKEEEGIVVENSYDELKKLPIINYRANEKFYQVAKSMSLDPDGFWLGRYVDWEWNHSKLFFESYRDYVPGNSALEFGCNFGATSIVLASLGFTVYAVDIDKEVLKLARLNAERYGLADNIHFYHVPDSLNLPFEENKYDCISCNSVLEYVKSEFLTGTLRELDRVLKKGGIFFIQGTSNRLWPKEFHSGRWFVNYLPDFLDPIIFKNEGSLRRGVFPWQITKVLKNYENLDFKDNGRTYNMFKQKSGCSLVKSKLLRLIGWNLLNLKISTGSIMPSMAFSLRKIS